MRIGIDGRALGTPSGGIRRYVENLVRGLRRSDPELDLVLFGGWRPEGRPDVAEGVRWDRLRLPWKGWLDPLVQLRATRGIDLIHGPNYSVPLVSAPSRVMTVHDLTVQLLPESHPLRRRLRHRLLPLMCRRADRIIADSRCTRDDLCRIFGVPEARIDVVHLAVEERFQPVSDADELDRIRASHALPETFVLYVGSIEPRKDTGALVEAVARLPRAARLPLVIAGSGSADRVRRLRQRAEAAGLREGRDLWLLGHVPDADLPALYTCARLFVYPSRYEGFGLPPLEAMACGTPTVLPRNSSLAELYSECSRMVEDCNPGALADAIREIAEPSAYRRHLIEQGLKTARSRTWTDVARETAAVYRVVGRGSRSASGALA